MMGLPSGFRWVCRKTKSDFMYSERGRGMKQVYVPFIKEGKRFVQPKFAALGEQEEYNTKKQCLARIKQLKKN